MPRSWRTWRLSLVEHLLASQESGLEEYRPWALMRTLQKRSGTQAISRTPLAAPKTEELMTSGSEGQRGARLKGVMQKDGKGRRSG